MVAANRRHVLLVTLFHVCVTAVFLGPIVAVSAQVPSNVTPEPQKGQKEEKHERAPVTLDGAVLFYVRGITAYPAGERAKIIGRRIRNLADDRSVSPDSLRVEESADRTEITAPGHIVVMLYDADAEVEGIPRNLLAEIVRDKITRAVKNYREVRAPGALLTRTLYALAATAMAVALVFLTIWLFRRLRKMLEARLIARIERLRAKSGDAIQTEPVWMLIWGLIGTVRAFIIIVIVYFYLNFVFALYPWTRPLAKLIFGIVLDPLRSIGAALVRSIPGLVFIVVLVVIARYLMEVVRLLFAGIARKRITLPGFEPEWAWPTYRIARLSIIAFTLVFAYPHIPGSSSGAFKGVSILLGLVLSLGSSSTIANVIAGYTMIYRRTFKTGDRIQINDIEGDVSETGALVTHLKTIKNEDIVVPNSVILNSSVTNYSTLARTRGLILHTSVGIGYETPWRQVEAMLKMAAERTTGLLKDPSPFVLLNALGDFAVTYELNVYSDSPHSKAERYAELHRNILDVFNEFGIQIMTPAYMGDPAQPKTVPRAQWFSPPATGPTSPGDK